MKGIPNNLTSLIGIVTSFTHEERKVLRLFKMDPFEIALGVCSLMMTVVGQIDASTFPIERLVTQFGGLGLAVWLVIHHTMVTIPNMQKQHQEERAATLAQFEKMFEEKRKAYQAQLDIQRTDFIETMTKLQCKYHNDKPGS